MLSPVIEGLEFLSAFNSEQLLEGSFYPYPHFADGETEA